MVNNSAVIQAFGVNHHHLASEWAAYSAGPRASWPGSGPEQTIVQVQGAGCRVCRRPDYLGDPIFAGLYDPNPRFALLQGRTV